MKAKKLKESFNADFSLIFQLYAAQVPQLDPLGVSSQRRAGPAAFPLGAGWGGGRGSVRAPASFRSGFAFRLGAWERGARTGDKGSRGGGFDRQLPCELNLGMVAG
eukprot:scaffold4841_cov121-Isochrysis_galbana.AAC.6